MTSQGLARPLTDARPSGTVAESGLQTPKSAFGVVFTGSIQHYIVRSNRDRFPANYLGSRTRECGK